MRAGWLVLAAACGAASPPPVQLFLDSRQCWPYGEGHVYAGAPVVRDLSWTCRKYYEGYSDSDAALCDRSIVDIQARCNGVACGETVVERTSKGEINQGSRRVRVTPLAPGPLHIEYEISHGNGARDVTEFTCSVEPKAELSLACTVRDRSTGAFVPCPTQLTAGTEVHLDAQVGGVAPDRGALSLEVRPAVGTGLDVPKCANQKRDDRGITRSCTWIAQPGRHDLRAYDGNLEQRIPVEVISPPGAPSAP